MKKAIIAPLLLLFLFGISHAGKQTVVKGLRYNEYKSYTRVVIDLSGPATFSKKRLKSPDRLIFDLKHTSLSDKSKTPMSINNNAIKAVRVGHYKEGTARIVFDLNNIEHFTSFTLNKPYRLVVDVYAKNSSAPVTDIKKPSKQLADKKLSGIRTVVIDAGHGGKDPGAVGPRGLKEKDITLDVGKKLGKILQKKHGMKVLYTRTSDKFIPLNNRTEMANAKKADLFISIHVNASEKRKVRGIETYFLNWTNNSEAINVAARENKISPQKMRKVQDGLQVILMDLAKKNKNEESMRLAHSVQNSLVNTLKKDYKKIEDLGVKYALFYVLVGAEMPSVLVEISFISNREEEKRLAGARYQNKIAEAIAKGITSYATRSTLFAKSTGQTY